MTEKFFVAYLVILGICILYGIYHTKKQTTKEGTPYDEGFKVGQQRVKDEVEQILYAYTDETSLRNQLTLLIGRGKI